MHENNPYTRGKAKLIADYILENWNSKSIFDHIKEHNLDKQFTKPVTMRNIYDVRGQLRKKGLIEAKPLPDANVDANTENPDPPGDKERYAIENATVEEKEIPPQNRTQLLIRKPDWDILSIDQINNIDDLGLRTEILEYKSGIEKIKQEITPDYATNEQFESFKNDMDGKIDNIIETLNALKGMKGQPQEEKKNPPIIVEKENPQQEGDILANPDEVIELEGQVISNKFIGFTPKSLMLFDLTKSQGFEGNLADFVNGCISDAFKGRNIKLSVVEETVIA